MFPGLALSVSSSLKLSQTFGSLVGTTGSSPMNNGRSWFGNRTVPASGWITGFTIPFDASGGPNNVKGELYADNGSGSPGALLYAGPSVQVASAGSLVVSGLMISVISGDTVYEGAAATNYNPQMLGKNPAAGYSSFRKENNFTSPANPMGTPDGTSSGENILGTIDLLSPRS